MSKIILRFVNDPSKLGRKFEYKTLAGARKKAQSLVGKHPRLDPDGYAVHRVTGDCLFCQGATFDELFPTFFDEIAPLVEANAERGCSRSHVAFHGDVEFYHDTAGNLCRASRTSPLDPEGYRQGGRFECAPRKDGHVQYLRDAYQLEI